MNKKFKFFISFVVLFLISVSLSYHKDVFASERNDFLNSMPEEMKKGIEADMGKRDLSGNGTAQSIYYKVDLKDESKRSKAPLKSDEILNSDLIYTPVSEEEYNENILKDKIQGRAVVEGIKDIEKPSWLKLSLYVDPHSSNKHRVTAYLYFDWLKSPGIRLKDANSLSWSSQLILPTTNNDIYTFFTAYFRDGTGQIYPKTTVKTGTYGMLQEVDLNQSRHYYQGVLGTDLEFAVKTNTQISANIFSEYAHAQVATNVSVGIDGKPSFGFGVSVDRVSGPVASVRNR